MKKRIKIITGSLLIAISYNIFFLSYDIIPNGIYGIASLINYVNNYDPALFLLMANVCLIILAYITLGPIKYKNYLLPGILIPLFIYIMNYFHLTVSFENLESITVVIAGSFITGLGYSLIYKAGDSVGGLDIIQDVLDSATTNKNKIVSYLVESIILLGTLLILGFESMLYSLIVILIIRYTATKSKIGISTSKMFYIITTKENEVKNYIMNELKHDLTEFNIKGGFSKNKSKIIMTSMDTKNYYELKEGVLLIDPKAFISITDGYEVINKNLSINKQDKNV
ncbi:MAG TPA: YitT family protein [Mollicutes bacterium]|nr:YitT family protein [Mollicutes bacterium]